MFPFIYCFAKADVLFVRYPVILVPNNELVEVHIGPTHDDLQNSVEFGEGDIASHLNAAPDGRLRITERDFDLVYLRGYLRS